MLVLEFCGVIWGIGGGVAWVVVWGRSSSSSSSSSSSVVLEVHGYTVFNCTLNLETLQTLVLSDYKVPNLKENR